MGKVISLMERTMETQIEDLNRELEEYERTLEMTEKILEEAKRELEAELASRAKPGIPSCGSLIKTAFRP